MYRACAFQYPCSLTLSMFKILFLSPSPCFQDLSTMPNRAPRGYYFGIARPEGELDRQNKQIELERQAVVESLRTGTSTGSEKRSSRRRIADNKAASPSLVAAQASASPSKRKLDAVSGRSSSSLSEASPLASPSTAPPVERGSNRATPSSSTSSDDAHQPPPAASLTQYQTFGPNPLTFDDPTIYEIREVTDDMTDEEKKEIYCVASFPHDDLKDLIAGTPPNKDFSNAVKPNNQVQYNTFTSYLDNFLRPLKEEDIGFLNERVSYMIISLVHLLTGFPRVIGQLHSLCLDEGNAIIARFGLKRMAHCPESHQNKTGYLQINHAGALTKWTMTRLRPIRSRAGPS